MKIKKVLLLFCLTIASLTLLSACFRPRVIIVDTAPRGGGYYRSAPPPRYAPRHHHHHYTPRYRGYSGRGHSKHHDSHRGRGPRR